MFHGKLTWTEAYNLPITYKRWYIQRVIKELNKSNSEGTEGATQSRDLQSSPEVRETQGRSRTQSPSRLRRFS